MTRLLLAIPPLVVLVAFALSNPQPVRLGLWPTDILLELPLSIAILAASGVFFVLGAAIGWAGAVGQRARVRAAQREARQLQAEVTSLRSQAPVPVLPPG
jgi:uncharacterized integral membrane protein